MKVNLTSGTSIEVPFAASELQYGQYTDFKACEALFFEENSVLPDGVDADDYEESELDSFKELKVTEDLSREHLIEAISYIVGEGASEIPFDIKNDDVSKLINQGYLIDLGEEISTLRLYAHIITVINTYKVDKEPIDKTFKLEWEGENYYIEPDAIQREIEQKTLTNGEVLTILELNRIASKKIQAKGDLDGNIEFNLGLEEVAILLRKEGEQLPMKRRDRITFIDKRKKLFEKIPLDIALNIGFFLMFIMEKSVKTRITTSFSTEKKKD
jgi:hypothetical protein